MRLTLAIILFSTAFTAFNAADAADKAVAATGPAPSMGFFVTSRGPGKGGDLGGLAGADRHCQALAAAVGAGGRAWRAYLSASATGTSPAVNARDRIGLGPWANYRGVLIARNAGELDETAKTLWEIAQGEAGENNVGAKLALTETGEPVAPLGGPAGRRNILTGSRPDGTAYRVGRNLTCDNWTSSRDDGAAQAGHADRAGGGPNVRSWNSAEATKGCSAAKLRESESDGLFYCFAER